MKRTLLALALLLSTTGLFAQVGMQMSNKQLQKAPVSKIEKQVLKSKKAAQPAKDGGREVLCDFSVAADYSFGTLAGHGVAGWGWNHQPDTNSLFGLQGDYLNTWLGIVDEDGNYADGWWVFVGDRGYVNPTWDNGFAYLDLLTIDNEGLTATGAMDCYVQLTNPIVGFEMNAIDVYFNQALMRFNADRYYIEWSNDPTFSSYDVLEFNVKGLEMNANDAFWGNKRVTLPKNTLNANSVGATADQLTYIRFRYTSPANEDQPHSYFWFIDDVAWEEAPAARMDVIDNQYCTGAYHSIPAVVVPDDVIYMVEVENTGATDYPDAILNNEYYSIEFAQDTTSEDVYTLVSSNVSLPAELKNTTTQTVESITGSDTTFAMRRNVQLVAGINEADETVAPLGNQGVGTYAALSKISSASANEEIALDDTLYYNVVDMDPALNGSYLWARGRNLLIEGNYGQFKYGLMKSGLNIYLTDEAAYNREGYEICIPYTANDTDGDLFLNGVQVVPAGEVCEAGAQIQAKLRKINWEAQSTDELVVEVLDAWDVPVESEVYELQSTDLNDGLFTDPDKVDVITPDQFKSIYLPFKNSVELVIGETYYACYRMASNGNFVIASDNPGLGTFGPGTNYYTSLMLIFTPGLPSSANYAWGGSFFFPEYVDYRTPLVHMVVGDASTRSLAEELTVTSSLNAYPNPAANNATISYTLNKSGNVNIVVTDLMGRVVMNMEQGNQTAGVAYTVDLNTANLANGTYFYTLNVNGEKQTKKFVVSK